VGKPLGKWPLGRLRRRRGNNIKMYLRKRGCEGGKWLELA